MIRPNRFRNFVLARFYSARSRRAARRAVSFKKKAEKFFRRYKGIEE